MAPVKPEQREYKQKQQLDEEQPYQVIEQDLQFLDQLVFATMPPGLKREYIISRIQAKDEVVHSMTNSPMMQTLLKDLDLQSTLIQRNPPLQVIIKQHPYITRVLDEVARSLSEVLKAIVAGAQLRQQSDEEKEDQTISCRMCKSSFCEDRDELFTCKDCEKCICEDCCE